MSNNTDTKDDGTFAFKKALEKGGEAQRDFIKSFSSIQQEGFQNFFTMLQGCHIIMQCLRQQFKAEAEFPFPRPRDRP